MGLLQTGRTSEAVSVPKRRGRIGGLMPERVIYHITDEVECGEEMESMIRSYQAITNIRARQGPELVQVPQLREPYAT